jgi:predicted O-linked N-acetylglucosamine transferase (SPINDLY family)
VRARLRAAFDQFVTVTGQSDAEVARLVRELDIDIAIDLGGYTNNSGLGVFAHRPAPVQLHYLGYAGTLALPYVDYLVADPVVIPAEQRRHYSEKLITLPDSYMVGDATLRIADRAFTRAECGLPAEGLVFCCFNDSDKLTPELFDVWMWLLAQVEGSVLWLAGTNPLAVANLRREAAARGVAPERLVFAERMAQLEDHLARHRLADLFLDTFHYNAHATANHALWAGLPVLTCPGETFASRVGASLLTAIGLPELIAGSPREYAALALDLATDPGKLRAIKDRLAANRATFPLFDTPRFVRHLEEGYTQIWGRHQAGLPPEDVHIC